jgi:anti-sigma factor RsiW
MNCLELREHVNAFIDGELPPLQTEEIEAHLGTCAPCRQAFARLQQLGSLLQEPSVPVVPENLAERVLGQARKRTERSRTAADMAWKPFPWKGSTSLPMRVAAAAVLLVGLSAGVLMGRQVGRRTAGASEQKGFRSTDAASVYSLDYLGGNPRGSLPEGYLKLVADIRRSGD